MTKRTFTALCTLAALAACQTQAPPNSALRFEGRQLDAGDFPAPGHVLRGFDYRHAEAPWLVGDEVLFGLRLRKEESLQHWLLRIRLVELEAVDDEGQPLSSVSWRLRSNGRIVNHRSRLCRAEVSIMDEEGNEMATSRPLLPRDFLSRGIASACQMMYSHTHRGDTGEVPTNFANKGLDPKPVEQAMVCAIALMQVVQEDSVLSPILWEVIEKPSVWSVVTSMGISVVVSPKFYRVDEAPCPVPGLHEKTWRLPISLHVNEQNALNLDMFVTDSSSPFGLAGGVLGAVARHPTKASVDFSLLLLSARRGSGAVTAGRE